MFTRNRQICRSESYRASRASQRKSNLGLPGRGSSYRRATGWLAASHAPGLAAGVRLAFEGVVHVRAAATEELDEAGAEVRREEERAPAFGLADVDALVGAREVERELVAAEHDVAQRHRAGAAAEQGEAAEEHLDDAAVQLEHPVDHLMPAAGHARERQERESEGGGRERPEISQGTARDHWMRTMIRSPTSPATVGSNIRCISCSPRAWPCRAPMPRATRLIGASDAPVAGA